MNVTMKGFMVMNMFFFKYQIYDDDVIHQNL